jgi:hypothetical protein
LTVAGAAIPWERAVFEAGTQLGRYEIQRRLGRGGMGTVYVAHDPVLGRMVAIKVFAGDLDMPDARERFAREARAAAALNHPNIVTVYDFGEYEAQPYIVMEYVPGETMGTLIRRKVPVAISDKLRWIQELCAGAGYAHQMSVIHRDIKPANLMIDRSGRLKILDFGIARMLGIASNTSVMIGTPGYMAPEQITGEPVDHRSDQFSIGVVFYELLAYTEAFPGETLPAITHRILSEKPKPLLGVAPDVTPEIAAIVEQALAKNMADRFPDTEALRSAIARVRKHMNSDDSWTGIVMPPNRDTPAGGINRGTGSARRRTGDALGVAQLTPPPDPRRDRDALARRRAAQVEAAIADARQLLANQQLEAALDACQQALTLDENHAAALQLEREIEEALKLRDGGIEIDDPDRTIASGPFAPDSRLFESQAVTRMHGDGYAVTGFPSQEQALAGSTPNTDQTVLRPAAASPDATVVVPARRTPAPAAARPATIPPAAKAPASPPVAKPATVPPVAKPAAPAPAAKQPAKVPVAKKPAGPDLLTRLKSIVLPAADNVAKGLSGIATAPKGNTRAILAGVAAVVVLAVLATVYFLTRGPAPTGTLVVDAVPWAAIKAIQSENGKAQELPAQASTPLSLALPAGTYQITLTGPPPESKEVTVSARVDVNGVAVVPITRFVVVTPEQYFEQYLGSTAASAPGDASQPAAAPAPGATPAAPAQPGGNK